MAKTKKAKAAPPQKQSKGKRHLIHAHSFEELAKQLDKGGGLTLTWGDLAALFKKEAARIHTILR